MKEEVKKKNAFSKVLSIGLVLLCVTMISLWGLSFKETPVAGLSVPYTYTSNASGIITVVYPNPYQIIPNVQANIVNQASTGRQLIRIYNNTVSGFTCQVYQQTSVIPALLNLEILLASTTPVANADVDFLITAKQ